MKREGRVQVSLNEDEMDVLDAVAYLIGKPQRRGEALRWLVQRAEGSDHRIPALVANRRDYQAKRDRPRLELVR